MKDETSLILMTRAEQMLAEATTIQKAKDLKDLALTAKDWAVRKGLGDKAIQQCLAYALDAERRLGELLHDTERARGTAGTLKGKDASGSPVLLPPEKKEPTLADLGITKNESARAQRLADFSDDEYQKVRDRKVARVAHTWGVLLESDSPEWWTPAKYIEAVREVMGEIDLDPASCSEANKTVRAKKFYDKQNDGISKAWKGRVFLNPPYGTGSADFIEKFFHDFGSTFEEGIVLVNSRATDADWFQPLFEGVLCFTDHRIDFDSLHKKKEQSTHGSCFIYFGPNEKKFAKVFSQFGPIVRKWPHDD